MLPRRDLPRLPLEVHLAELRRRLLVSLAFLFGLWVLLFSFFPRLTPVFLWPYRRALGDFSARMVFTTLPEAIMAALKATFFLALALMLPLLLYQGWAYISPGLFPEERRLGRRLLVISFFLMLAGGLAGYFVFLPALLHFFLSFGYAHFEANLRLQNYLSFMAKTLLVSVLLSEIPLLVALLTRVKIISRRVLSRRRWHLLGGLYLVALFLTPGDFLSQILLLLTLYLFLELGFLLARFL
ncbi:twin-arginine translocase subunit TatC [Thermosulfurimonas marina]|uniref:Sec-independent protein translocase protein TatC n=1 Tax=Thermosulfurimonas marina TaxID=2047767 RepID=A0A6H1WUK2_9BACT|nr:twin-arginine translocase subunit TatC [Thermosulfurimonas marina]QJA06883.1 twin-arginine translocase subunit TatC [Thermosulfurimonas marina]